MIDSDTVRQIRSLAQLGWGSKRICKVVKVSRNTVRRYLRLGDVPLPLCQSRDRRRVLNGAAIAEAEELLCTRAGGNAVVVHRLLALSGVAAGLRTIQRAVRGKRDQQRRSQLATVRFETAPGEQLQIDFGQKMVQIGDQPTKTRVYFFVAVLGYSRRIFIRLSLNERIEEWQSGLAGAFAHFGGTPNQILIDNPKAMVLSHDAKSRKVVLNASFAAFVRDWDINIRACAPYRARTKGKTESGVKYFKNNCLANLSFTGFHALEQHVAIWMHQADQRIHGTTHEVPQQRFLMAEKQALNPLPNRPLSHRTRRLRRKVANDCLVNIDTVRYSVHHSFVGEIVEVHVGHDEVQIYAGAVVIAQHRRCHEPHSVVKNSQHYDGLLRRNNGHPERNKHQNHDEAQRPLSVYEDMIQAGESK